ncbi:bactofilin family protein [Bacillus taeanensis]|uniref:Polymer-forming cytoskeletal protein n=1 Tax=Bacillus taeanensis TaxID=273032 RepID=A0A366XUG2_9BACI|nr:polymer-forming cytoskeletal protein [Bacillus taeanensis]RBW69537.1 polymer-forming cytoskeletal protein [Bacillus taeanensis]
MFNKHVRQLENVDTVIGSKTTIEGKLVVQASIRIDGTVKDDINCEGDVIVSENGLIESNIRARNIIVSGTVKGNISTDGKLHIQSSGKCFGNAEMKSIVIDEGGLFQGSLSMEQVPEKVEIITAEMEYPQEKQAFVD